MIYPGRVGLQQRLMPGYRAGFFEALAEACEGGLSVFAGDAGKEEAVIPFESLRQARFVKAHNRHFLKASSPFYLLWQGGLNQWLERWDPDVLVIEANHRYLSSRVAIQWMHARGRPVVAWGLGVRQPGGVGGERGYLARIHAAWQRKFLLSCDGVIAYSQNGAREYVSLGFPEEVVFVAHNAVTPKPSSASPERPPVFDGRLTVLFVGRIQRRKRIDNLLRACAGLPKSLQPRLVIVGNGPDREMSERLAGDIYPEARFIGIRQGHELTRVFQSADLFVLPGTGGLAVQEAMANALPVIVAEGDGTQNDLVRPENGWLIPSDDVHVLRSTLEQALSDVNRLRRMGKASFRIIHEEINIEKMVEIFVQALNSVKYIRADRPTKSA